MLPLHDKLQGCLLPGASACIWEKGLQQEYIADHSCVTLGAQVARICMLDVSPSTGIEALVLGRLEEPPATELPPLKKQGTVQTMSWLG
jgi:hypothetical protein